MQIWAKSSSVFVGLFHETVLDELSDSFSRWSREARINPDWIDRQGRAHDAQASASRYCVVVMREL
jgi:hypothetical protein